jgi:hypothetical protein
MPPESENLEGLKNALAASRSELKELKGQLTSLRSQFTGIDPAAVVQMKEKLSQYEAAEKTAAEKKLEEAQKWDELKTGYTHQINALMQERDEARSQLSNYRIETEFLKAYNSNTVRGIAGNEPLLLTALTKGTLPYQLAVEQDKTVVKENGTVKMSGDRPMTVSELLTGPVRAQFPQMFGNIGDGVGSGTPPETRVGATGSKRIIPAAKASKLSPKDIDDIAAGKAVLS